MKEFHGWVDPKKLPTGEDQGFSKVEFGLNVGILTKLKYSENLGHKKDMKGLNIEWEILGKKYFNDIWFPDESSPYYDKNHDKCINTLTHYSVILGSKENATKYLNRKFKTYKDYFKAIEIVCKGSIGKTFDVFLEYENKIRQGKKIAYLIFPRTNSQGNIIQKHYPDVLWKKEITEKGSLNYVMINENNEKILKDGEERLHSFKRSAWYMNQNYANQLKLEGDSDYSYDVEEDNYTGTEEDNDFFSDEEDDTNTTDTSTTDNTNTDDEDDLPF